MRKMIRNRYGDTMSFELIDKDTILWRGSKSDYGRMSMNEAGTITMIDPPGGPYLAQGSHMGWLYDDQGGEEFEYLVVDHFQDHDEGFLIICKQDTKEFFKGRAM